jgi:hypothetical protein
VSERNTPGLLAVWLGSWVKRTGVHEHGFNLDGERIDLILQFELPNFVLDLLFHFTFGMFVIWSCTFLRLREDQESGYMLKYF